jgi:hypothetical protein
MNATDIAIKNFEIANLQLTARVRMRYNVLLVYLAAIGTIFSIALGTIAKPEILLTIPYLALGCAIILSHHNILIGALLDFCSKEIRGFIRQTAPEEEAPQFDSSDSFKKYFSPTLKFRTWGHGIIIIIPCFVPLAFNWNHAINSAFPLGTVWWFAALCSVGCIYTILSVN